jgi:hypothetical protein
LDYCGHRSERRWQDYLFMISFLIFLLRYCSTASAISTTTKHIIETMNGKPLCHTLEPRLIVYVYEYIGPAKLPPIALAEEMTVVANATRSGGKSSTKIDLSSELRPMPEPKMQKPCKVSEICGN